MRTGMAKEVFNVAYVLALAAQAGLNTSEPRVDEDSVDLMIIGSGFNGRRRDPQISLQLKCSSQDLISGEHIKFPLKLKNYNDLRGRNISNPRYLVVLLVPPNQDAWMQHHPEHVSLHNNCYWLSIMDHPETHNSDSVTVDVPLSQRLTSAQLKQLMVEASDWEAA
jgi:hypothetical protein